MNDRSIVAATKEYEAWLATFVTLVNEDIQFKHQQMAGDIFAFFRATFYRWAERWTRICPNEAAAPIVLGVGDLHVENFGTWRDSEGRLVWGINDFDEAQRLAYTNDLVRLGASARVALRAGHLSVPFKSACEDILAGYQEGLRVGGRPFVLAENDRWLRTLALSDVRDSVTFWQRMNALLPFRGEPDPTAKAALLKQLPDGATQIRIVRRRAGEGSLGRPRLVALASWQGAHIAREAKAFAPSAWRWAYPSTGASQARSYREILQRAVRCPDPCLHLDTGWIVRRLSPDCGRIELSALPIKRDEHKLLHTMGWETANIHLGAGPRRTQEIQRDLAKRGSDWLRVAARSMVKALRSDWDDWRAHVG